MNYFQFILGLPNTKLGAYLENRVNSFLRKKDTGAGEVVIRILSSSDKASEVKFGMKNRYELIVKMRKENFYRNFYMVLIIFFK